LGDYREYLFAGHDVSDFFYIYPIWILIFIAVSFIGGNAGKTLMLFFFWPTNDVNWINLY
jgi:hypothetical protein